MSEYISRNEAYQELREARCCDMTDEWGRGYNAGITEAMDRINNFIPPADVAPVVHGHWMLDDCFCSKCKAGAAYSSGGWKVRTRYCPNCGAKMYESEGEE